MKLRNWRQWPALAVFALALVASGCGGKDDDDDEESPQHEAEEAASGGLSAFELEHGIGPVKEPIALGAIDAAMAATGKAVFEAKCTACHKMDTLYIGPALGEVTARRSGAFIMNMILNPQEMVERHPVAKQMLAERMSFMANQGLTRDEARAVLEYLRTQSKNAPKP
jgi:mono/diheme cytochrome c family protein